MCTIGELSNSIRELFNWIRELSNSNTELSDSIKKLSYLESYLIELQVCLILTYP